MQADKLPARLLGHSREDLESARKFTRRCLRYATDKKQREDLEKTLEEIRRDLCKYF